MLTDDGQDEFPNDPARVRTRLLSGLKWTDDPVHCHVKAHLTVTLSRSAVRVEPNPACLALQTRRDGDAVRIRFVLPDDDGPFRLPINKV